MSAMCHLLTHAAQQTASLLDHFVGELLQIERHLDAKHLGGREIDDEIELCGPLDRQVARPLTLENAGGVDANPAIAIGGAGAVAIRPPAAGSSRRW